MRLYEDIETGKWMSELDNELLRNELAEAGARLLRAEAERDVLERVMTTALTAGAEATLTAGAGTPPTRSGRRLRSA